MVISEVIQFLPIALKVLSIALVLVTIFLAFKAIMAPEDEKTKAFKTVSKALLSLAIAYLCIALI